MAEPSSEMQSTGARFLQKAEAVTFALNGFTSPRDVGCQRRKSNVLKTGFESHQLAAEISRLWRISLMAILSFHPPTKHVIYRGNSLETPMFGVCSLFTPMFRNSRLHPNVWVLSSFHPDASVAHSWQRRGRHGSS